jgi:flagellin-like protein
MGPSRRRTELRLSNRGVSSVVGVALLVAVVVVLAAVTTGAFLGFQDRLAEPAPYGAFTTEYVRDGAGNTDDRPYIVVTHEGLEVVDGTKTFVVDSDGNEVAWADVWTGGPEVAPGEHLHLDGHQSDGALNAPCEGEVYRVVWRDGDRSSVVSEHRVTRPPVGPAAVHC